MKTSAADCIEKPVKNLQYINELTPLSKAWSLKVKHYKNMVNATGILSREQTDKSNIGLKGGNCRLVNFFSNLLLLPFGRMLPS